MYSIMLATVCRDGLSGEVITRSAKTDQTCYTDYNSREMEVTT